MGKDKKQKKKSKTDYPEVTYEDYSDIEDCDWEDEEEEECSEYSEDEELQAVFDSFDGGKGFMYKKALNRALQSLGYFFTKKELRNLAKDYDTDDDGTISFEEFQELVYDLYEEEEEEEEDEEDEEDSDEDNSYTPINSEITTSPTTPATSSGKVIKKAVFIGVNYPGSSAPLQGCVNDVRMMKNLLEKKCKMKILNSKIFVDEKKFRDRTGQPTKKNIIEAMKWLGSDNQPGDNIFLHFSGHGTQVKAKHDKHEVDGMDEAICPSDCETHGLIIDDDIYKLCVKYVPAGCRLTAVMDCCHSGSIMDLPFNFTGSREGIARARSGGSVTIRGSESNRNNPAGTVFMLSGCQDNQTSADTCTSSGEAGGACTLAICSVLGETPKLPLIDLLENMRRSLASERYTQIPQLSSSHTLKASQRFSFAGA